MATPNQGGFQVLLDAEKEATALINESRQYRTQRLKDARTEALAEIEALKKQKEEELLENDKRFATELEETSKEFQAATEEKLQETEALVAQNRAQVVKMLLKGVTRCEPHLHPNAALRLKKSQLQKQ